MAKPTSKRAKSASPQILIPNRTFWHPAMFQKQLDLFNAPARHILVSGPRLSGKSIAVYHKLIRHAWETRGCRIGIFVKSIKSGKIGSWGAITGPIMREWLEAKLTSPHATFDWVKEPWIDGATRMHYFRIRNYWGEESEIQLHSLEHDSEVENKLLDAYFSMLYFVELQKFSERSVFDISVEQLRMPGVPYDKHLWLSDTNPPDDGDRHFAHDIWFKEAKQEDLPDQLQGKLDMPEFRTYQKTFAIHAFEIDDNIFLEPQKKRDLKLRYANDPEGWQRFVEGKWIRTKSSKERHFFGIFKQETHIIGDCSSYDKAQWQIIVPTKQTTLLLTGWDIGEVNHAFGIHEPIINERDDLCFVKLDELLWIGVQEPLRDFIFEALELIDKIETIVKDKTGRPPQWRHWSDTSAWRYSGKMEEQYDALLVNKLTEGKVNLLAATRAKERNSIRRRIKMEQDLLRQDRIIVSAHCTYTIQMYEELRSGKIDAEGRGEVIVKGDSNKHMFDADSYVHFCELYAEAQEPADKVETGSRLISVPL